MKVLLLDDHFGARLTFGAVLEQAGFEVVEAATLAEARQQLVAHHFQAAVLDVNVPDGLGTELIGELRGLHRGVLVALLSGEDAERGVADFVFVKSEPPADHVALLKQALEGGHR